MALLILTSRLFIRSWIASATAVTVLSSAKLCKSEPSEKNLSFMNMLKNIGSSIYPCGMSDRINFKKLKLFLILTHCFCPLRYDSISFRVLVSKPYSSSFATSKSWDKQLKAFDRSIRVARQSCFRQDICAMFLSFSREHVDNYIASYKPKGIQEV